MRTFKYYKKIKDGEIVGAISANCEQPTSDKVVEITLSEFDTIQEDLKQAEQEAEMETE
jgi:hypothetical protein